MVMTHFTLNLMALRRTLKPWKLIFALVLLRLQTLTGIACFHHAFTTQLLRPSLLPVPHLRLANKMWESMPFHIFLNNSRPNFLSAWPKTGESFTDHTNQTALYGNHATSMSATVWKWAQIISTFLPCFTHTSWGASALATWLTVFQPLAQAMQESVAQVKPSSSLDFSL